MSAAAITLLRDFPSHLRTLVFNENATALDLLTIAISWAIFWFVFFSIAGPILRSITYGKPWLRSMSERAYDRMSKEELKMMENIFGCLGKEEFIDKSMKEWAPGQVIMFQHVCGGLLCLPALVGYGDPAWANSLAIFGLLSEMGCEIMDMVVNVIYTRFFTEDGAKKLPIGLFVVLCLHHALATTLGIPMALGYRDLRALHWLIFELQGAGALLPLTEYTKMLDLSKGSDLQKFKLINLFLLVVFSWTRLFHFVYLIGQIILTWYNDKAWSYMAFGAVPLLAFCFFNLMIVSGTYKRWVKFRNASSEHESLPVDVSDKRRRQSVINLEIAAGALIQREELRPQVPADFLELVSELFEERPTIERRKSMPSLKRDAMISRRSLRMMRGVSVPAGYWKEE